MLSCCIRTSDLNHDHEGGTSHAPSIVSTRVVNTLWSLRALSKSKWIILYLKNRFLITLLIPFAKCLSLDFNSNQDKFTQYYSLLRFHPDALIPFINGNNASYSLRNFDSVSHGIDSETSVYSWLVEQFQFPFGISPAHGKKIVRNSFGRSFGFPSIISPNITNPNISFECLIGLTGFAEELHNSTLWALKSAKIFYLLFCYIMLLIHYVILLVSTNFCYAVNGDHF